MIFSIIIPVYNRPDEIEELLSSLTQQSYQNSFEIVVVEDGSTISSQEVVERFQSRLNVTYHFKKNSGPGDSRNVGMRMAKGDYFLIFDSDCVIPSHYLDEVSKQLSNKFVDCFGGADRAQDSYSDIQKAINYSMTSFLTTGGVRGGESKKFQPRSFNMGLSKQAFEQTGGFGKIHPGEDPELVFRLWKLGFKTAFFSKAYVFHKRRIDFKKFQIQVNKFGKVRPIIESWHPEFRKITFWFPTLVIGGFLVSVVCSFFNFKHLLYLYFLYFGVVFIHSWMTTQKIKIAVWSVLAVWIQFWGYGKGYLQSVIQIRYLKKKPKEVFPDLFFN